MTLSVRIKLPDPLRFEPEDVDHAVARVKREVLWGFLRRRLLEDDLDGRTALALAEQARDLYAKSLASPARRRARRR
ncbi:MAG: hypothetical protein OEM49_10240 [Myxococcales bacterium]|nr:hypothetical protein [Myxococcales bacterium]MDH5566671.1 hypothetical protein [Myxococcales bacterium]